MMTTQNVTLRIQRFNPDTDSKPYLKEFTLETGRGMTILDALHQIKTEQDGSLTYRRSCRHAICGSCAMNVNGSNLLVCKTPLKDLVVDRSSFWEQYLRVKPWLIPPEDVPEKEFRVSPDEVAALNNAETCIMCGACYSACQVIGMNKKYIGPHALLKAFLRVLDPRDTAPADRLADLAGGDGVYRCHTIFNCIDACPKGLNPTEAIETLRKLARKRQAYERDRIARQASLNEPVNL
jgi:succinate dehydrogenase / fumarate reductase iron-sulfur subunit